MLVGFVVSYIVLWVLVLAMGLSLFALYRVNGQMLLATRTPSEVPVGGRVPMLEALAVSGVSVRLGRTDGRIQVVQIVSGSCGSCDGAVMGLGEWMANAPEASACEVVLLLTGPGPVKRLPTSPGSPLAHVVQDPKWDLAMRWGCRRVPWTMVIGPDGRVLASDSPVQPSEFRQLVMVAQASTHVHRDPASATLAFS